MSSQIRSDARIITPFIEQNRKIQAFIYLVKSGTGSEPYLQSSAQEVVNQVRECERILEDIRENTSRYGTSLGQSYLISRTAQQLKRIVIIVQFLTPGALP